MFICVKSLPAIYFTIHVYCCMIKFDVRLTRLSKIFLINPYEDNFDYKRMLEKERESKEKVSYNTYAVITKSYM